MSISYRNRNNKWEYRIRYKDVYTGKPREKSKGGFAQKRDAKQAVEDLDLSLYDGYSERDGNPPFGKYMLKWYETVKPNYSFNTQIVKEQAINRISQKLADVALKDINYYIINKYLNELNTAGYSRSVIEHDYTVIHQTIIQALRDRYFTHNPIDGIKLPKGAPHKKLRWWTLQDLNQFIVAQNNRIKILHGRPQQRRSEYFAIRDLAIFVTMAGSGAREGELCGLLVDSYDRTNRLLLLHHNLTTKSKNDLVDKFERSEIMKTNASYREVPLPEMVCNALDRWLAVRDDFKKLFGQAEDDGSMFPAYMGIRPIVPGTLRQQLTKICIRYNLPIINVHGMRHTYASFLHQSNVSAKEAQVLLGHKDIQTTLNVYTHVSETGKRKAVDLLDNLLNDNLNLPDPNDSKK